MVHRDLRVLWVPWVRPGETDGKAAWVIPVPLDVLDQPVHQGEMVLRVGPAGPGITDVLDLRARQVLRVQLGRIAASASWA